MVRHAAQAKAVSHVVVAVNALLKPEFRRLTPQLRQLTTSRELPTTTSALGYPRETSLPMTFPAEAT